MQKRQQITIAEMNNTTQADKSQLTLPIQQTNITEHKIQSDYEVMQVKSINKKVCCVIVVVIVILLASIGLNGYLGWKVYQTKDIGITVKTFNYSSTCSSQGYEIDLSGYTGSSYTATINMVPSCSNSTATNQSRLLSDTTCLKYDGSGSCCSWCYQFNWWGQCTQQSNVPPSMHTVSCAALDSTTNQYKLTSCLATSSFEKLFFYCATVVILLMSMII